MKGIAESSLTPGCLRRCLSALWAIQVFGLAACAPGGNVALTERDLDVIEQMTEAWVDAHAEQDWRALAEMYTDDAVLMPPFSPIIQGRATIRDWFAENEQYSSVDLTILETDGYGDLAYVRGRSMVTISPPGQDSVSITGKFLHIRRRDSAGAWRVSVDIFSPNEPVG